MFAYLGQSVKLATVDADSNESEKKKKKKTRNKEREIALRNDLQCDLHRILFVQDFRAFCL